MGGGAPPSANEAVEIAPSSTSVASIKRTTLFMGSILRGISPPYFFRGRKSEVFEKRAMENYFSSVYRQTESWLEPFKLVA
jgi:hypothetical protein